MKRLALYRWLQLSFDEVNPMRVRRLLTVHNNGTISENAIYLMSGLAVVKRARLFWALWREINET